MPRDAQLMGFVKLRQIYSRSGHNYVAMTVPIGVARFLGWKPGTFLSFHITKDGGLKLMPQTTLVPVFDDIHPGTIAGGDDVRGPRPGSVAARELEVSDHLEEMIERSKGRREEPEPRRRSGLKKRKPHR